MQSFRQDLYLEETPVVQLHREHRLLLEYIAEQNDRGIAPSEPLLRDKLGFGKHQMERYMRYLKELQIIEPEDRKAGGLIVAGGVGSGRGYKITDNFNNISVVYTG